MFQEDGRTIFYGGLLNQSTNPVEHTWQYLPAILPMS